MLKPGQVFNNRYKIISTLGEGGFGAVYKVWDDNLQRFCAIKENLQVSEDAQKQFRREAIMLANLNHPHLVRVTDYFFISDRGQYLVMDYVEGDNLETILTNNKGPLPSDQALAWIRQVCDALIYIHNQNPPIIHRDVKPANIRITPQGNAVLVDFGLAKSFDVGAKTTMGARGLTPHFAAPEQYGTGGTDAQSDIYSLGVTLYCMLTYRVPPDSVEIMVGNANPPPPAKAINSNIPDAISDAIQCAMQIRRTDRYKSTGDFKTALLAEKGLPNQKPKPPVVAHESEEDIYRKAIDADPTNIEAYDNLGEFLWEQQRIKESERVYRKAIEVNPTDPDAYHIFCTFLELEDRLKEAEEIYCKAINANPTNVKVYINFCTFLEEQGRMKEVEEIYCKAVAANITDIEIYDGFGVVLENQGRLKEAEEIYRKAIDSNPNSAKAYIGLGSLLESQDRLKEAEETYRKAVNANSDDWVYYLLAVLLDKQNRMKEAEETYRKAIIANPNFSGAYSGLGFLFHKQNRIKEAEEAYCKAIAADPKNDIAYFNLGILFEKQNRIKEAEEAYRKAASAHPSASTSVTAYNHLGNLLKAQNRITEAEEAYRMAKRFKDMWDDIESRFGKL